MAASVNEGVSDKEPWSMASSKLGPRVESLVVRHEKGRVASNASVGSPPSIMSSVEIVARQLKHLLRNNRVL